MILSRLLLALAAASLSVPALAQDGVQDAANSAEAPTFFYPEGAKGDFDLETAVANAREEHRYALVVFGADWCHDSRALARVLTSAEFQDRFGTRFIVTFIDVGKPQTGHGHNLDLVKGLGVPALRSTPALFVLSGTGKPLNSAQDAVSWRNASKRSTAQVFSWFSAFLKKHDRR